VKPPASPGDLLYHVDFLSLPPISRSVPIGEKVFSQQIGNQHLPPGWNINHHETTTAADYMIAETSGVQAFGVRHNRGGKTEVLCRLDSVIGTTGIGESRVFRVTYQFEGIGIAHAGVKLDKDPYTKHVMEPLTPTNGGWQQAEFTFTRPSADPVVFICNLAPDPKSPGAAGGTLWIRSVDVWKERVAAAPGANTTQFAGWKSGSVIYKTDFSTIEPFLVTKEGTKARAGTPEQLPKGIKATTWKSNAAAEFRCESINGSHTLGLANLSSEKSGQIAFELEREMDLHLTPGKAYRVTVEYTTQNTASGALNVQTPDMNFQRTLHIPLLTTDGAWKTASGDFERKDGELIRLQLENFTVGEGNIVSIRSIEVRELVRPG
jgi:hypothetical protein